MDVGIISEQEINLQKLKVQLVQWNEKLGKYTERYENVLNKKCTTLKEQKKNISQLKVKALF